MIYSTHYTIIWPVHVIIQCAYNELCYTVACAKYSVHIRRVQYQYPLGTRDHINAWHNLLSLSNCFCIGSQFESRANCPISSGIKIQHFVFVIFGISHEALIIYVGASPVHNIRRHVTNLAIR